MRTAGGIIAEGDTMRTVGGVSTTGAAFQRALLLRKQSLARTSLHVPVLLRGALCASTSSNGVNRCSNTNRSSSKLRAAVGGAGGDGPNLPGAVQRLLPGTLEERWGFFSVYCVWIVHVSLQLFREELMDVGVPDPVVNVAVSGSAATLALLWDQLVSGPRRRRAAMMEAEFSAKLSMQEKIEREIAAKLEAQEQRALLEDQMRAALGVPPGCPVPPAPATAATALTLTPAPTASPAPAMSGSSSSGSGAAALPATGDLGQLLRIAAGAPSDAGVSVTYSLQPLAGNAGNVVGTECGVALNLQVRFVPAAAGEEDRASVGQDRASDGRDAGVSGNSSNGSSNS